MVSRFDHAFSDELADLVAWRRDVRRFKRDPVDEVLLDRLLDLAQFAPSVGNSQPWRWMSVESPAARRQVQESFRKSNAQALAGYEGERATLYAQLKLAGLDAAPVHYAVFADHDTPQGHGLGRRTMPETIDYSVVNSILLFWLVARAEGLGVGWVSILDPETMTNVLEPPAPWRFIAYLCVGWPVETHLEPELARHGWQHRTTVGRVVIRR